MAKRTYTVTFSNFAGVLDRETFQADDEDYFRGDAGATAREIAERMIRDAEYLRPGDVIRVVEG